MSETPAAPDLIRRLRKIELHVHLEGSLSSPTRQVLARRNITAIRPEPPNGSFTDFASFLKAFGRLTFLLVTPVDFTDAVIAYGRDLAAQGGIYAEVTLTLSTHVHKKGLDPEAVMGACWAGALQVERETGVILRFILDHVRNHSVQRCAEVLEWCLAFRHFGVVALGLAGPERGHPASVHHSVLRRAEQLSVPFVPHAGEATGPAGIRDVLPYAPRRVGHAISALADPALVRELSSRQIMVEACLTSNLVLGHVATLADHPLRRYVEVGLDTSINTDDPAMFGTTLCREYTLARDEIGLTEEALAELNRAAVDHILADDTVKQRLRDRLNVAR
jgi:aminodeoxyfutalosine deaminase